ncbi:hypothetical protein BJY00DRAFT_299767 [Aspergillus carlsbadensis]|nr:hypothetical protein BJY00DRAFT_299767 [Aspergillus carlsbadensis]
MKFSSQPAAPPTLNLTGQTGIITGASSGIGYAAATTLLSYNLTHLIITVRTERKGTDAATKLRKQYPNARIDVWMLDMLSYESIRAFVARCQRELDRVDFVVLSAAVGHPRFERAPGTNHEVSFQVNYLSTVLLAVLLLPVLREKRASVDGGGAGAGAGGPSNLKPGKITIIGSGMALTSKLTEAGTNKEPPTTTLFSALDDPKHWDYQGRYATTKLLLCMFVKKLAEHVRADDVVLNLVDPGLVRQTGQEASGSRVTKVLFGILRAVMGRSLAAGAWTYVDAAVVKGGESHGSWLCNWGVFPFPALMYTEHGKRATEMLWEETLADLDFAGVRGILASMGAVPGSAPAPAA